MMGINLLYIKIVFKLQKINYKRFICKNKLITKNIKGKYPATNWLLLFCHYCMMRDNFYCWWNTYPLDLLFLYVHQVSVLFFLYWYPKYTHICRQIHNLCTNYHVTMNLSTIPFHFLANDLSKSLSIFDLLV